MSLCPKFDRKLSKITLTIFLRARAGAEWPLKVGKNPWKRPNCAFNWIPRQIFVTQKTLSDKIGLTCKRNHKNKILLLNHALFQPNNLLLYENQLHYSKCISMWFQIFWVSDLQRLIRKIPCYVEENHFEQLISIIDLYSLYKIYKKCLLKCVYHQDQLARRLNWRTLFFRKW